jgi:adenylate cyclase
MVDTSAIVDFLVRGAPGAPTPMAVLERICPELRDAGVPIDRVAAFVRTLHPHIMGRRFTWTPGQKVTISEASFAWLHSPDFLKSPVYQVVEHGAPLRIRLAKGERADLDLDHLQREGFTDYYVTPMRFMSGQLHPIAWATRHPDGFTEEHLAAIERVMPPLSRVGEIFALMRTAANLLSTYVGRNAGERIMAGKIQRGDVETLRAIIWFSDLRGFTSLAGEVTPSELIGMLNDLFECQVPHIEAHGGEVLKFIGDGLLAIFPVEGDKTPAMQAEAALLASDEAMKALADRNREAKERGGREMRFGLALHLGDVAYGNIGGSGRLDFTCIGPAVNVASRLEGVSSKLGLTRVLSADVAGLVQRAKKPLGEFELKGVAAAQAVFGLDE